MLCPTCNFDYVVHDRGRYMRPTACSTCWSPRARGLEASGELFDRFVLALNGHPRSYRYVGPPLEFMLARARTADEFTRFCDAMLQVDVESFVEKISRDLDDDEYERVGLEQCLSTLRADAAAGIWRWRAQDLVARALEAFTRARAHHLSLVDRGA